MSAAGIALGSIGTGATNATVLDLAAGGNTANQLVLPWAGKIYASGFVDASTNSASASRLRCNLEISDGTGPANGLTMFGQLDFGDSPATSNYHVTLPLGGVASKPAGTYDVAIRCTAIGSPTWSSYSASLDTFAVPS